MAHIADHLSVEELGRRARTSADACAARHYQAIWLLAQGAAGVGDGGRHRLRAALA
ncbi:hypothetical protein [Methylobacterium longum]|uniref:Uncharacterized protein n=1 Tax=Methylobacterium longum TaxID=767694 RepID=A0ABT8AS95_9HYPH|nr:hypothetical protein [Methylobacterium longum]MDN3572807.1 hypothetical protein [Methylobacterium longum]GJE10068.1 hypothetical protein FOHLNKBM_1100 [Methylobacterium longum]